MNSSNLPALMDKKLINVIGSTHFSSSWAQQRRSRA
jgi:hypothetical protein